MSEIIAVYARVVHAHCVEAGVPEDLLFRETGLDAEQLMLQSLIPARPFAQFLENAQRLTGDRSLGLLIGQFNTPAALGETGLAMAVAPTIMEGLRVVEQFSRLLASYIQVELISQLATLSVRFKMLDPIGDVERLHVEAAAMFVQAYIEMVTGLRLDDAEIRMSFERPEYADRYPEHFHSAFSFGWEQASIELPRHWTEWRSPYYQAELWQRAQLQLAQQLRDIGRRDEASFTRHVRALLQSCEPPLPRLGEVAQRLHLSDRTLNRRLQDESASFRELRAQITNRWARQYLVATDLSIDAIAAQLGYRDAANFRRAFRNANACSPSDYRQRAALDSASEGSDRADDRLSG